MCLESSFCFGDRTDTMRRAVSREREQGHIGPPGASSLLRSQRVVTLNSFPPADPASEQSGDPSVPSSPAAVQGLPALSHPRPLGSDGGGRQLTGRWGCRGWEGPTESPSLPLAPPAWGGGSWGTEGSGFPGPVSALVTGLVGKSDTRPNPDRVS